LPCIELKSRADDARCMKRCQKKRSCGKHKCGELCCIMVEHLCTLICGKMLSCGLHKCDQMCHRGNCFKCPQVSFEELACYCGASITYPPVPCGTRPPECFQPCQRGRSCGHPVMHNCHSDESCPPCTHLTSKMCFGGHELRKNVPCYLDGISCGKPCGKPLECDKHFCGKPCHLGPCMTSDCKQPCKSLRSCGHPCGFPCHSGECPDVPCSTQVKITCSCGNRRAGVACSESFYSRVSTALLATRMQDVQGGNSVDLKELSSKERKLECNEDCLKIERNCKLAAALHISNPELSSKIIPRYSEFMRDWAKRDANFCNMVHSKLADLVRLSKESKQKSRAFSFPCMNREKRQFVHEYSEHFCCESASYDAEPKRNVVVTALKDKSCSPTISLMDFVAKQKKAPVPPTSQISRAEVLKPNFVPLSRGTNNDAKIDWFGE